MKLLVISTNYPSRKEPSRGTFVYKFVQFLCKLEIDVIVISPLKYQKMFAKNKYYGEELAKVYRPFFISYSNIKLFSFNSYYLTRASISLSLKKTLNKYLIEPDVVYCHFLSNGLFYYQAFKEKRRPLFIGVGENMNIDIIKSYYDLDYYNEFLRNVDGFIAVSSIVSDKLIEIGVEKKKILIAPNGTDLQMFKPRNKFELRRKYGFPNDKKIILFVGRFIQSKGIAKLIEALSFLDDGYRAILIGKGEYRPKHSKILFCNSLSHEIVSEFMSLSDIFVLPTLHEGSSNVIAEAMASGLPIVSSDIAEIREQCDESNSILVDPLNSFEIADAVKRILTNQDLENLMSIRSLEKARKLDLSNRVKEIVDFIQINTLKKNVNK